MILMSGDQNVVPSACGRGLGQRLVGEIERLAAARGRTTVRLDTRADLTEARRLSARLDYAEVTPFDEGPDADHWFTKDLTPTARPASRPR